MRRFILLIFALVLMLMLMPAMADASSLASQLVIDEKVVTNVAKALPQSTQSAIFTITGGPIEILSLTGEVTTEIASATDKITLRANPTTGSDTDLTTGATISGDAAGTIYSLVTSLSTDMAEYTNGAGVGLSGVTIIVPAGSIDVESTESITGNITWRLRYRPLHHGVTVTAN